MDILSLTTESDEGNVCALIVCDYFTKFVWAIPLKNHRATTVADALLHHVFLKMGLPTFIHSDMGKEFQSELILELSKLLQITKTRTTPYRPQSDGLVERMNRTCLDMMSKLCEGNPADWDQHMPFVTAAYNSTPHASSGCSPNLLMFMRETTLPIDLIYEVPRPAQHPSCPNAYVEWAREQIEVNFKFAREELGRAAQRQKKYYDEATSARQLEVGAFVWRLYPPLAASDKLNPRNIGPYKVVRNCGHGVYSLLRRPDGVPVKVHIDHLKLHHGKTGWSEEDEEDNRTDLQARRRVTRRRLRRSVGESQGMTQDPIKDADGPDFNEESAQASVGEAQATDLDDGHTPGEEEEGSEEEEGGGERGCDLGRGRRATKLPSRFRDFEMC